MTSKNDSFTLEKCRYHDHLTLKNEIEEISKLEGFMEAVGDQTGIDASLITSLNLALEEAVTNVILYAYPEGQEGKADIDVYVNQEELKFVLRDSGTPFDPTAKEDADVTLSLEDRPIGGLGIFMVKQIMDTIEYEYRENQNILILHKKITEI